MQDRANDVIAPLLTREHVSATTVLLQLTGHQIAAAAATASADGDVRLASLLLGSGGRAEASHLISNQLKVWEADRVGQGGRFVDHIQEKRLLAYRLLAREVDAVISKLPLHKDWHRSLGMYLWCVAFR